MTDPLIPTKTQWKSFQLSDAASLTAPKQAAQKVRQLANTIDKIATALKATIDLLAKLSTNFLDPAKLGLKTIIDTAKKLLEDLTGVGGEGVYQITIPVNPLDAYIPDSIAYEKYPGNDFLAKKLSYVSRQNLGRKGNAGNYGFMAKLRESLYDENDQFRPRFDESAYVAGMILVLGSTSPAKLLQLIDKLMALVSGIPSPSALKESIRESFGPQLGIPKLENLRANLVPMSYISCEKGAPKVVAARDDASTSIGVKVEWDPLLTKYYVSGFPSDSLTGPIKWKITGLGIFDFDKFSPGVEYQISTPPEYILFKGDFDFLQNVYLLAGLRPGVHHIAVQLMYKEVYQSAGNGVEEELRGDYSTDMQVVTVTIPDGQQFFNRTGVPPNWNALPSPLAMIPALVRVVEEVIVFLENIEKILESASDKVKKFVAELKRTINQYVDWAESIATTITELLDALAFPDVYTGYTTFYGQGGNSLMLNQLGEALFSNDPNAPPFNEGTEPVMGIVIMAGSNSAGTIDNFVKSMELIFNANFETEVDTDIAEAQNAWNAAVDSIDILTEDVNRQISFTDDMIAQINETLPESEAKNAFGIDMQPSTEAVGCS